MNNTYKRNAWLIAFLVALAFKLFYLTPWGYIKGVYSTRDVALVLIWVLIIKYIISQTDAARLRGPIVWLMGFYFLLVLVHVTLASFNYSQSLLNGLIAARSQFMYGAFFLFIFMFENSRAIVRVLDVLSALAVLILTLAVINYFFPVVFHQQQWGEWEVYRAGIRRAFIPAMPLINLGAVWMFCRWADTSRGRGGAVVPFAALFLLAGHFFHQSRGQIWGLLAALIVLALIGRRFVQLGYVLGAALIAGVVLSVTMPENLLLNPFTSTFKDLSEGSGTVKARESQLADDIKVFMEHPWIGSGAIALRASKADEVQMAHDVSISSLTHKVDLGYPHWVKMYGVMGVIWLFLLYYFLYKRARENYRNSNGDDKLVSLWALVFLAFIAVSGVTLNQFLVPEQILLMCLLPAAVVRVGQFGRVDKSAELAMPRTTSATRDVGRVLRPKKR